MREGEREGVGEVGEAGGEAAGEQGGEAELRQRIQAAEAQSRELSEQLKRLQGVAQLVGELIRPLGPNLFVVRGSNGGRYMVGARAELLSSPGLVPGARVCLDISTLLIMRVLPRDVDPAVQKMETEEAGSVAFAEVGGLAEELRQLREVVELPLRQPEVYRRLGIRPPNGVLLYGPPGTGKTLLARALASQLGFTFIKVVGSSVVDKYIGESGRLIREMFARARVRQPCIIFIDEVDAIGGRRLPDGNSSDREIQRTLLELLSQMDGFRELSQVKVIMATNRPDTLDPALLRPGRLDRKIEIPLPGDTARRQVLNIHLGKVPLEAGVELGPLVELTDGLSAADLRNLVTEAAILAIRQDLPRVHQHHLSQAARKLQAAKALESRFQFQFQFSVYYPLDPSIQKRKARCHDREVE